MKIMESTQQIMLERLKHMGDPALLHLQMKRISQKLEQCKREIGRLRHEIHNKDKVIERYEDSAVVRSAGVDKAIATDPSSEGTISLGVLSQAELDEFPAIRPKIRGKSLILPDNGWRKRGIQPRLNNDKPVASTSRDRQRATAKVTNNVQIRPSVITEETRTKKIKNR